MSLREMMKPGEAKFGTFVVEFATPGIGYILKNAGCDYAFLDLEHSGFSIESLKSVLRYTEAAGLPSIIGLPSKDPHAISRVLDMGAEGVIAVARMKYAPHGARAVSAGVAHDRWGTRPLSETLAAANERVVYFVKVETARGVEAVEDIVAVDGVDGLWIGHGDLSVSLGHPGEFDHPDFLAASDRVIAACVEEGLALCRAGFTFIGYSADAWILRDGLGRAIADMRRGLNR
jgi:2-dehydro-3-deoxyglucarate aldolase/4-hydroxy-2-oxoheptanedioate aldolase